MDMIHGIHYYLGIYTLQEDLHQLHWYAVWMTLRRKRVQVEDRNFPLARQQRVRAGADRIT